jgi:signal transduction histidine kinase
MASSAIPSRWKRLSLAAQFVIAGSVVLVAGMAAIGFWVTQRIEDGVTHNTAVSTALFMESLVAPVVQELARVDRLSAENQEKLDRLLGGSELGRQVVSFKVWKQGGLIAYSSHHAIIGTTYPTTPNLEQAWTGKVTAEFDTLEDEEDALERAAGLPLLEMYSPIRQTGTGRIIAVAEFYETAEALNENLFWATLESWVVVAIVTLAMLGALSGIVFRGSSTIERQRIALQDRIDELSLLLAQNEELRSRVQRASRRTAEINERYLRRISADLHDGPAQLLALALLRLDALKPLIRKHVGKEVDRSDVDIVRGSLTDAITEVRDICAGLTLPELDGLCPAKLLKNAASAHERWTKTSVAVDIQSAPQALSKSLKICLYRFVQEGLSNAFRHAGGADQQLSCRFEAQMLEVEISDSGPGFQPSKRTEGAHGLGLPGLRERIESLGGSLKIISMPGEGTRLVMCCIVDNEETHDAEQD